MTEPIKESVPANTIKDHDQALEYIEDRHNYYVDPSDDGYINNLDYAVLDLRGLLLPDTEDSLFGLQAVLDQERNKKRKRHAREQDSTAWFLDETLPESDVLQHVVPAAAALLEIHGQDRTSHRIAVWALKNVACHCASTIDGAPVVIAAARLLANIPDTICEAD